MLTTRNHGRNSNRDSCSWKLEPDWKRSVEYDKTEMPESYDRGRGYSPEVLRLWLDAISAHVPKESVSGIVDIGCGTGRFSGPLADHFDASLVGVEPSGKMLRQARNKGANSRVTFLTGSGEAIPVGDDSADLVFMSMVFHHFDNPNLVARECCRVLRRNGAVCLRNATIDQFASFPYLDFFPGIRAIIAEQLSSCERIRSVFHSSGFETVAHDIVVHPMAPGWKAFAEKVAHRTDSFLSRLPDEEFRQGLAAIRAYAETADPMEAVTENVDLFVFRLPQK